MTVALVLTQKPIYLAGVIRWLTRWSSEISTMADGCGRFKALADVPPEMEWFANLDNVGTRRAFEARSRMSKPEVQVLLIIDSDSIVALR